MIAVWLAVLTAGRAQDSDFPRKPIKVVVPFGSGGASDTLARVVQEGVRRSQVSPEPFVIVNVPGVGGSLGSRRVKNARPDGYTILNLHEGILTARYSGTVEYGPEAFVPIASTGQAHTVVCTGPDSQWTSLDQILKAAKEKPGTLLYGGNLGAPSHFVGLLLEHLVEGAEFKIVPLGGGAERYSKLAGGHIDLAIFSLSEYKEFRKTPERPEGLRGIVYLAPERHSEFPDLPTATEQGYDLVTGTTQYWWAPKGTSQDRIDKLADILESSMQSEFVQERYGEMGIEPVLLRGDALVESVEAADAQLAALDLDTGTKPESLPLVPLLSGLCVVFGFGHWVLGKRSVEQAEKKEALSRMGLVMAVLLVSYLFLLQVRGVPYWASTSAFAAISGVVLVRSVRGKMIAVGIGIVLGVGLNYLFKSVLVIDLP